MSYHEFSIAGFLGLFPPFVVFHPPAAMDRRTIENPFLTRDVFLVRCPSPHGPSVLPLLRLMRLGAWRSLAIFCAFFLMLLPCFLSFSFMFAGSFVSCFVDAIPVGKVIPSTPSLPHRLGSPPMEWGPQLEPCQLLHGWMWLVALLSESRSVIGWGGVVPMADCVAMRSWAAGGIAFALTFHCLLVRPGPASLGSQQSMGAGPSAAISLISSGLRRDAAATSGDEDR